MQRNALRELIISNFEEIVAFLNSGEEDYKELAGGPVENFPSAHSQESGRRRNLFLSISIVDEVITRYLEDDERIAEICPRIDEGTSLFRKLGYLIYWIAKLKPVMILFKEASEAERLANEWLCVGLLCGVLYNQFGSLPPITQQIRIDLLHSLRYENNTGHNLGLAYQALYGYLEYGRT